MTYFLRQIKYITVCGEIVKIVSGDHESVCSSPLCCCSDEFTRDMNDINLREIEEHEH